MHDPDHDQLAAEHERQRLQEATNVASKRGLPGTTYLDPVGDLQKRVDEQRRQRAGGLGPADWRAVEAEADWTAVQDRADAWEAAYGPAHAEEARIQARIAALPEGELTVTLPPRDEPTPANEATFPDHLLRMLPYDSRQRVAKLDHERARHSRYLLWLDDQKRDRVRKLRKIHREIAELEAQATRALRLAVDAGSLDPAIPVAIANTPVQDAIMHAMQRAGLADPVESAHGFTVRTLSVFTGKSNDSVRSALRALHAARRVACVIDDVDGRAKRWLLTASEQNGSEPS